MKPYMIKILLARLFVIFCVMFPLISAILVDNFLSPDGNREEFPMGSTWQCLWAFSKIGFQVLIFFFLFSRNPSFCQTFFKNFKIDFFRLGVFFVFHQICVFLNFFWTFFVRFFGGIFWGYFEFRTNIIGRKLFFKSLENNTVYYYYRDVYVYHLKSVQAYFSWV